jgi:predicted dehydrogenase
MSGNDVTRRGFITTTGALALGAAVLPRGAPGQARAAQPGKLRIAVVGVGGMGFENMRALLSENIVAVCDVDFGYCDRSLQGRLRPNEGGVVDPQQIALKDAYVAARKYADYRIMLQREARNIDAVVIATPDHTHAVIAAAAMKAGKHVYLQKPLTYSIHEARALARIARERRVVTQMGNQGHSGEGTQRITELVQSGVLGPVREVHVWTDRPVRYWAQGIPRPPAPGQTAAGATPTTPAGPSALAAAAAAPGAASTTATPTQAAPMPAAPVWTGTAPQADPLHPRWSVRTIDQAVLEAMTEQPRTPPPGVNWDLFLGPAPEIPYHPAYHPFSWRGWTDFGVGAIGDMGAHLIDQPYLALGLTYPTAIMASGTQWGGGPQSPASYPLAMFVQYDFPARGTQPPVRLYWYDSGLLPPRPPFLPDDVTISEGDGSGGIIIGERGIITFQTYGQNFKVYPASVAEEAARVPMTRPRITVSHEMNWVNAIKGQGQPTCPFEYAAPLTEVMLLGLVAMKAGPGKKILYDAANMRVTNSPEVSQWLVRPYRAGWSL